MAINLGPPIPNPQRLNGMSFKERLKLLDISAILLIYNCDNEGFCINLNENNIFFDSVRNLMRHGLIKIDIFENDEGYCTGFSVTEAGKQMCDKMMEIAKQ